MLFMLCLLFSGLVGCNQEAIDLTTTDELVIYVPGYKYFDTDDKKFRKAISDFKMEYPDVNLVVETIGDESNSPYDQYQSRVNSELMAGSGPDIILTEYFQDLYKSIDMGVFLDLSSIIEQDREFMMEEYNEVVMSAGAYKGGQYMLPTSYYLPVLITEQEALRSIGFDVNESTDFVSFFTEIAKCLPKMQENPTFSRVIVSRIDDRILNTSGIKLYDYEQEEVLPDEAVFKTLCEVIKPYWPIETSDNWPNATTKVSENILIGSYFFYSDWTPSTNCLLVWSEIKAFQGTPILTAIRTIDGGLNAEVLKGLAIRAGSKNQRNAWNFIKIMLSETIQYSIPGYGIIEGFPVNKAALLREITDVSNEDSWTGLNQGVFLLAIPWEEKEPFLQLHESITSVSFRNIIFLGIFQNCMESYLLDERPYDECVMELINNVKLYVSE